MCTILLVEDDEFKREKVRTYLLSRWSGIKVTEAHSYKSGLALALQGQYTLVLLDMSIPTFDVGPEEPGGEPQPFGGRELLRDLEYYEVRCRVIVITSLDVFGLGDASISLTELDIELRDEHPGSYIGYVQYSAVSERWKDELSGLIAPAVSGGTTS